MPRGDAGIKGGKIVATGKGVEIAIKQATERDIETLQEMHRDGTLNWDARYLVGSSKEKTFVAKNKGFIVGYCIAAISSHYPETGRIRTIEVIRGFRRKGIGKLLESSAEAFLWSSGVERVIMDTARWGSIRFHKKRGFRVTERRALADASMSKEMQEWFARPKSRLKRLAHRIRRRHAA